MKKHSFTQKVIDFLNGKGFYIALAFCLLAIGASCWYLWWEFSTASQLASEVSTAETVTLEPEAEDAGAEASVSVDPADTAPETEEEEAPGVSTPAASDSSANDSVSTIAETEEAAQETLEPVADLPAEPAEETLSETNSWVWPLEGDVVAAFSTDTLTYNSALGDWRTHNGIDLSAELGQTVVAAHAGTVISIQDDVLLGRTVTVDCGNGLTTTYGNLAEELSVSSGDVIASGDAIGTVGDTAAGEEHEGAWLHFAVAQDGEGVDPSDFLS